MTSVDNTGQLNPLAAKDFELLLEASRAVSSTLDIRQLLRTVMALAARVVNAEAASILLVDEKKQELYFDTALGGAEGKLGVVRLQVGEGIAGWVARERQPLVVNDVRHDPRWSGRADQTTDFVSRQIMAVPLLSGGRLLGVVEGINKAGGGEFTGQDRRALEIFASQVAVAVENARLFESVREEKEALAALFREMSDGALLLDEEGRVVLLNTSGAVLLGAGDAVGRPVGELLRGFDARRAWDEAWAAGGAAAIEFARTTGKTLILAGSLQRLGGGRGWLFIFRDVTDQKREERLKRNFFSLVSHKLRTPLAVITGYAPLLLQDKGLSLMARRGLEAIDAQGRRLASLVDKLLRFTALEAEDLNLTRQPLVAGLEIGTVLKDMAPALAAQGAAVTVEPGVDGLPSVLADAARFRDVFRDLVENAVKFNPRPDKRVVLTGEAREDGVWIRVSDNGPGIPPEEIPRLFQRFHQIEDNFTGQVEGAGLGLAFCKRLIEAHGGALAVESGGPGAVFVTRWPRAGG